MKVVSDGKKCYEENSAVECDRVTEWAMLGDQRRPLRGCDTQGET